MTDRELLEAAAKAAGYVIESFTAAGGCWAYVDGAAMNSDGEPPIFKWHPLADDGDALRLAMALNLSVEVHSDSSQPLLWLRVVDRDGRWTHAGPGGAHEEDRGASTRRAITRAAAAMVTR